MNNIELDTKVILVVGRRGSGKSELMKHLIEKSRRNYNSVMVVSSSDFNGFYAGFVGRQNVSLEYDDDQIGLLLDKMARVNRDKTKDDKNFKKVLLVLDDVVSEVDLHTCKNLEKIFTRGRHLGICCLVGSQYIKKLSPTMRNNASYLFLGKQNRNSFNIIEEEYNMNLSKKQFKSMLEQAGIDYNFLVIDCESSNPAETYGLIKIDL